jgi:hypothetical protein
MFFKILNLIPLCLITSSAISSGIWLVLCIDISYDYLSDEEDTSAHHFSSTQSRKLFSQILISHINFDIFPNAITISQ